MTELEKLKYAAELNSVGKNILRVEKRADAEDSYILFFNGKALAYGNYDEVFRAIFVAHMMLLIIALE